MHNSRWRFLVSPFLFFLAFDSVKAECRVDSFSALQPVGEARLKVWFWDVYDAQLRTDSGDYQNARQRALQLHYLRNIAADDLVKTTKKEWQRLAIEVSEKHQNWLAQLRLIWPDVHKGDCITLIEDQQGHARFYGVGGFLGAIKSPEFTRDFLAIWLDEDSRFKAERDQLIGVQ